MSADRPVVVVVAEARPMRGGIATFAETITDDARLLERFDMRLHNTARVATREGGRFNLQNLGYLLEDVARVARVSRGADLVHLQLVADPGLPSLRAAAMILAARFGGARLIAHVHSAVGNAGRPELARYGLIDRVALRSLALSRVVCTVSSPGTATMRRFAGRTPVVTVDNAVDVWAFDPSPSTAAEPTVLFVGVICKRKGTVDLARAARRLRKAGMTDWRLVVVGGQGPTPQDEFDDIVREFAEAGLADALVGPEWGPAVRKRLAEAHVFVLPSYLEGQPIAILEAMASGRPIIGTSIGAVPDLVHHGVEGLIVEPGDEEALAVALRQLIRAPDRRRSMGAAARQRAERFHSLERLSARLTDLYDAVLAGHPVPSSVPTQEKDPIR